MKPYFSVIIPLYNKASNVRMAVESVMKQDFTDWELVVVDDSSTDGGADIVKGFTDPRIHLVRLDKNSGVSVARNTGVAASCGDYLCFLDADDWWTPSFLEEMSQLIVEFPDAGIYGANYTIVNETKHKTRVAQIGLDNNFEKGYIKYCQSYAKSGYMPLTSISVVIPRGVFEETEGFPKGIKLGEDFILWIHIALKYKVAFLNKPLAFYNQDVDVKSRSVGHLHPPQYHMFWNLSDLEDVEKSNNDYKHLIDNLRVYGLLPYYLSKEYHKDAVRELSKVDWRKQPKRTWLQYHQPLTLARIIYRTIMIGSKAKHLLMNLIEK